LCHQCYTLLAEVSRHNAANQLRLARELPFMLQQVRSRADRATPRDAVCLSQAGAVHRQVGYDLRAGETVAALLEASRATTEVGITEAHVATLVRLYHTQRQPKCARQHLRYVCVRRGLTPGWAQVPAALDGLVLLRGQGHGAKPGAHLCRFLPCPIRGRPPRGAWYLPRPLIRSGRMAPQVFLRLRLDGARLVMDNGGLGIDTAVRLVSRLCIRRPTHAGSAVGRGPAGGAADADGAAVLRPQLPGH
jgi:hypothetical protein